MSASANGAHAVGGLRSATPAPTREEAAAIIAALERFKRAAAPPPAAAQPDDADPWTRAAMREGIERGVRAEGRDPWSRA